MGSTSQSSAAERMQRGEPITLEEAKVLAESPDALTATAARHFVEQYPKLRAELEASIRFMQEQDRANPGVGRILTPSDERFMRGEGIWWAWYTMREADRYKAKAAVLEASAPTRAIGEEWALRIHLEWIHAHRLTTARAIRAGYAQADPIDVPIMQRDEITPEVMEESANDVEARGRRLQFVRGRKIWSGFTAEGLIGAD